MCFLCSEEEKTFLEIGPYDLNIVCYRIRSKYGDKVRSGTPPAPPCACATMSPCTCCGYPGTPAASLPSPLDFLLQSYSFLMGALQPHPTQLQVATAYPDLIGEDPSNALANLTL